jgi:hypothetical protein
MIKTQLYGEKNPIVNMLKNQDLIAIRQPFCEKAALQPKRSRHQEDGLAEQKRGRSKIHKVRQINTVFLHGQV